MKFAEEYISLAYLPHPESSILPIQGDNQAQEGKSKNLHPTGTESRKSKNADTVGKGKKVKASGDLDGQMINGLLVKVCTLLLRWLSHLHDKFEAVREHRMTAIEYSQL